MIFLSPSRNMNANGNAVSSAASISRGASSVCRLLCFLFARAGFGWARPVRRRAALPAAAGSRTWCRCDVQQIVARGQLTSLTCRDVFRAKRDGGAPRRAKAKGRRFAESVVVGFQFGFGTSSPGGPKCRTPGGRALPRRKRFGRTTAPNSSNSARVKARRPVGITIGFGAAFRRAPVIASATPANETRP